MNIFHLSDCPVESAFSQAMPFEFQQQDPVQAYRSYYLATKVLTDSKWTNRRRDLPDWLFHAALKT